MEMEWNLIVRLCVAGLCGTVIGLDREYRVKDAGFRTHFLVALGSALMMIVSQYGFEDFLATHDGLRLDPSRIAAQVVSGIGFIGAGTIIIHRQLVRGLTTAASLWATAGIGLAAGGHMYIVAGAGKGGVGADEVALALLPRVLAVVNGENWNLQCVENRPENISAGNLFDGSLPGLSGGRLVSLWGVAWRQRVIMPPLIDFTAPDRYPTDPDAGKVPAPWNDPLAEFLRLGLKLKTVPDETGAPHISSDDIIAVRGENHE